MILYYTSSILSFLPKPFASSWSVIRVGIWGCIAVGILCYLFRDSSPYNARLMAAGIGMGIAAAMNAVFWMLEE